MPVTTRELHMFEAQRKRAAKLVDVIGEIPISELLLDVRGNARLNVFAAKNQTVGDFLRATAIEIQRTPSMGRVGMTGLYAALERLAEAAAKKHGLLARLTDPSPGRDGDTRHPSTDPIGDEISRLIAIETRLSASTMPDGTPRQPGDIARAATAIYNALIRRESCV